MIHASFGSISHGTMREEDLIPDFAHELEYHVQRNAAEWCSDEGRAQRDSFLSLVNEARDLLETDEETGNYTDREGASDVLESLFDSLQTFAPPYAYFGSHPGDGSDFGFWLSESFEEEFDGLKVNDLSEIPADFVDSVKAQHVNNEILVVNDHGNSTLYYMDAQGELHEVWSII